MPPPNPFKKAQDNVESKWLEEVYVDGVWLSYDHWSATYEPKKEKKEDSEFKKQMKFKAEAKAKKALLDQLQTGISKNLVFLILEVSSQVLQKLQQDHDEKLLGPTKDMINCISAIVLSYRFETSKTKAKTTYFRKTACDQLTEILDSLGNNLSSVQKDLRSRLADKSGTRAMISNQLDSLFVVANDELDTQLEKAKEKALKSPEMTQADAVLQAAGIERPPKDEIETEAKSTKDNLAQTIAMVVKGAILEKLESINDMISKMLDALFVAYTLTTAKAKQSTIAETVEGMFVELKEGINKEVANVLFTVTTLIDMKQEEEKDGNDTGSAAP